MTDEVKCTNQDPPKPKCRTCGSDDPKVRLGVLSHYDDGGICDDESFHPKPVKPAEERIREARAEHDLSCSCGGNQAHWTGCRMARILRGEGDR